MKHQQSNHPTIQPSNLPGQALVTLLVFVAIATVIVASAVAVTIINSQTTSKYSIGEEALAVAEAGADNAILRILRDPNSTYGGETFTIGNGSATISVNYALPTVTINSIGTVGSFVRNIEVIGNYSNNKFSITSFKEVD
ncbi:hypothetical protein A3J17_05120 [Candidatus Curtissbacteria bacterium RIFCSPLOWO2_02_FULL_40_11]|uniref:Type 4 fimbrial biogenesis protein PilX N-terminal domain-containing protein n=2 Tax=Candidatus Curtissiibacteriota TaxID=1752717 RepID=A0A1F5GCC0_9BACT|nr:MAG: hypothetical protein A2775_00145 [Candidatus Curtissbacteria bacterium RIFCSPHIGHO2_01_FULL_39_57]OGD89467.1 MAG: hypothetical protein A3D04_02065 [Candidatus Curtissbacteria bacterium RIFCSPHIGHO2_02_FULL_40_16b]OGE00514.1 MAG: hypothetical protein A3J17_05120 [Candidatus Curtissbacteria bacterium RIFCSPLOWO2_02_FULL_40_11]OGE13240.1 MAG: hypothetical protein A3G14_00505 [Candidatus Curtissbacteria bacterium RIFCSPLOWO2_12_FULL_38_9]